MKNKEMKQKTSVKGVKEEMEFVTGGTEKKASFGTSFQVSQDGLKLYSQG